MGKFLIFAGVVVFIVLILMKLFGQDKSINFSCTSCTSPGCLGGFIGWAYGGPLGGIIGLALGNLVNNLYGEKPDPSMMGQTRPQQNFKASLLVLSAAVMKADGTVKKSELDFVKQFFVNNFGVEQAEKDILLLREILKQDINIPDVAKQIVVYLNYPSRLQLLRYLFGIAQADGQVAESEIDTVHLISQYMRIKEFDYESTKAMFVTKETKDPYVILGINRNATDDEVKRAYREMAKKHHPDKVAYLGEDVKRDAEEKFKEINDAYNKICKERNI